MLNIRELTFDRVDNCWILARPGYWALRIRWPGIRLIRRSPREYADTPLLPDLTRYFGEDSDA